MFLSLKKYIKDYIIKIKTKIDVDNEFYDSDVFYLIDLEG